MADFSRYANKAKSVQFAAAAASSPYSSSSSDNPKPTSADPELDDMVNHLVTRGHSIGKYLHKFRKLDLPVSASRHQRDAGVGKGQRCKGESWTRSRSSLLNSDRRRRRQTAQAARVLASPKKSVSKTTRHGMRRMAKWGDWRKAACPTFKKARAARTSVITRSAGAAGRFYTQAHSRQAAGTPSS